MCNTAENIAGPNIKVDFFAVPPGLSSIENDAHGIEKLLLKTLVSEKFLHSEVNLLIQHIC